MVCIPCIVAPVLLFIWYRFIQPVVLKIWNPWAPKKCVEGSSDVSRGAENEAKSSCPFIKKSEFSDGKISKTEGKSTQGNMITDDQSKKEALDKKSD